MNSKNMFFMLLMLNMSLLLIRMKSLLMMLFAFEFIMLNIFFMYSFSKNLSDMSSSLIFLAMVAGEASLGLSLLVSMVRSYGKDNKKSSKLLLCEGF